jgi:Xaa-Pro aminopeptidase
LSHKKKITLLRNLLKKKDCNYYLLPRTDKFLNEFISEEDERVKWLTGFTGSFAFVIVSLKQNAVFSDGRYVSQIKKQVDPKNFQIFNIDEQDPISWLKERIKRREKVLIDSWLFTCKDFNYIKKII